MTIPVGGFTDLVMNGRCESWLRVALTALESVEAQIRIDLSVMADSPLHEPKRLATLERELDVVVLTRLHVRNLLALATTTA